jgi:hypothetical protein
MRFETPLMQRLSKILEAPSASALSLARLPSPGFRSNGRFLLVGSQFSANEKSWWRESDNAPPLPPAVANFEIVLCRGV